MFSNKRGRKHGAGVACIFVHAGAGYHSSQNEHIHLAACHDAAKAAMAVLKNGGAAVDAVEIAIKVLEDREITNAGYGSNLTLDGVVECDAVIVDHCGRSGAAGAVAQIKNPISLARLLLDRSTETLTLKRVPPNLLVGQGATDFAYEHDMLVLPLDFLISPGARSRWYKWRRELERAEDEKRQQEAEHFGSHMLPSFHDVTESVMNQTDSENLRKTHTRAMLASVWNEAQSMSPPPSGSRSAWNQQLSRRFSSSQDFAAETGDTYTDPFGPPTHHSKAEATADEDDLHPSIFDTASFMVSRQGASSDRHQSLGDSEDLRYPPSGRADARVQMAPPYVGLGTHTDHRSTATHREQQQFYAQEAMSQLSDTSTQESCHGPSVIQNHDEHSEGADGVEDCVNDTVGAIAVDLAGNIACGASSGGIGMKHRGRIGPAALVGAGVAVMPADDDDADGTVVATVTSGTGEHIVTTMAASVCNERVYDNVRKVSRSGYEECNDDEALRAFIERDFANHASVKNSTSSGAIGMLTVKKTSDGIYLYFGHNTESFALASMHSNESKPVSTMSRSAGRGTIAQGGRAIRSRKRKP